MNFNIKAAGSVMMGALCQFSPFAIQAQEKQPNVIVVITDDQGYGDLACLGNNIIKTPAIDKFFSESVRLNNFHVSPTCAPTRSSLFTGRYANRVGVWHTVGGRSILWEDETCMAEVFNDNGYETGLFGKWHLGDNYPSRPSDKGFSEVLVHGGGGISQGPDYWENNYFNDTYRHNGKNEKYEGYCTDVFFDEAINFIGENKDKPFFCYISTNAPHGPLNVPAKYHKMYEDEESLLPEQRRFYGMITNADDNFKKLRKALKKNKLEDNTILIFMTDNGSAHGYRFRKGKTYGDNGGMRGMKNSEFEGGHRVPFFIKWPNGNIEGGKDIHTLSAHVDLFPTLVDLCGFDYKSEKGFDGTSLSPLLKDENASIEDRFLVVDSQRRQALIKWRKSAVMKGDYRLVNGTKFYDLTKDPMQKKDIAKQNPSLVKEYRNAYENWWSSLNVPNLIDRYAYIVAGTEHENPVRISAHDMHTESTKAHHQEGALLGNNPLGVIKVKIASAGKYKFKLCRYPLESEKGFWDEIPMIKGDFEIQKDRPGSKFLDLKRASLSIAEFDRSKPIRKTDKNIDFVLDLQEGKYDMRTTFTDANGVRYPAYYIYIEKLDK